MTMPVDPLTFSQAAPRVNVGVLTRISTQEIRGNVSAEFEA